MISSLMSIPILVDESRMKFMLIFFFSVNVRKGCGMLQTPEVHLVRVEGEGNGPLGGCNG